MDAAISQPKLWEGNRVHRLRELIAAAFSASAIAETLETESGLSVTRDAVTSKARALGLQCAGRAGRPRGAPSSDAGPKQFQHEGRDWRARISGFMLHPRPLPLSELRMGPRGYARAFADLEPGCCAWPVSEWLEEGTAASPFCCESVAPGRPYCRAHAEIAFVARVAA